MNQLLSDGLLLAAALLATAALVVLLFRPIVRWIAVNVGDWLAEIIINAVQSVLESLDTVVEETPSPIDNQALTELKQRVQALEDELNALRNAG
jgi:hypothetical protein